MMIRKFQLWIRQKFSDDSCSHAPPSDGNKERSETIIATSSKRENELDVDVLIVGGGIVGASLALYLARSSSDSDVKIQVVDREYVGSEASGLSAGTIWAAGWGDRSHGGLFLGEETMSLLKYLDGKGRDFELNISGAMSIATNEDQRTRQSNSVKRLVPHGYEGTMLVGREAILSHAPHLGSSTSVVAASLWPKSAHVDPHKLTIAIAEEAEDLGANILEGVEIVGVTPISSDTEENVDDKQSAVRCPFRYRVVASDGRSWRARNVVIAAGAWCKSIGRSLGLQVPVVPVKGQMWITEPLPRDTMPNLIFTTESHEWWGSNSSRDDAHGVPEYCTHDFEGNLLCRHAYGRQKEDGCVIFGGDRVMCDPGDYTVNDVDLERNREYVLEFFPNLRSAAVEGSWAGIMGFSMDGKPLIGELSDVGYPGLWIAAGFGPHGIMEGPGAMRILSDAMKGPLDDEAGKIIKPYDPCRVGGGSPESS